MSVEVAPSTAAGFARDVLVGAGAAQQVADVVADGLVDADLHGVESHGLSRLGIYAERVANGAVAPGPAVSTVSEWSTGSVLDAGHSFGAWSASVAVDRVVDLARDNGMATVVVRAAEHFGRAAQWSERIADAGMIGIVASNTTPLMPPVGGAQAVVGNNPLSIAAPGGESAYFTDMALSAVALGKILLAESAGTQIPDTWATDAEGRPTTDPAAARSGRLLPAAGPKGFGLAFFVEMLTGVLGGGAVAGAVNSIYRDRSAPNDCSHVFIAIDVSRFMPVPTFQERADAFAAEVRDSRPAPGTEQIYAPGDLEHQTAEQRRIRILLSDKLVDELRAVGHRFGVSADVLTGDPLIEEGLT